MKKLEVKKALEENIIYEKALKYSKPDTLLIAPNTKLGNIPHISTLPISHCPGKSSWCSANCYTLGVTKARLSPDVDRLSSKYVKQAYTAYLSQNNLELLYEKLMHSLKYSNIRTIRLFVEGDWISIGQIETFMKALRQFPDIKFFFFTRSWTISNLFEALKELMSLPNVKGHLSYDDTMPDPPPGYIVASTGTKHAGVLCLEQMHGITCGECGICFNKNINKNIIFLNTNTDSRRVSKMTEEEKLILKRTYLFKRGTR